MTAGKHEGPRSSWRCTARDANGHRCIWDALHGGLCRAFGHDFSGRPKSVRRKASRIRKAVEP